MKNTLFAGLMLCFLPHCFANVTIVTKSVPPTVAGTEYMFYSQISQASDNDPTPNPCYQKYGCSLFFFTFAESWLPAGAQVAGWYTSSDEGWPLLNANRSYKTLGEWVAAMRQSGTLSRVGGSFLTSGTGAKNPCVVLAAGFPSLMANSVLSNCARDTVQAPSCKVMPAQLYVDFGTVSPRELATKTVTTPFSLQCNTTTDVTIETNSREIMPLNNSSDTVAEFDWGQGFGLPGRVRVTANTLQGLALRTRLKGFNNNTTGDYRGSTVVNISYY